MSFEDLGISKKDELDIRELAVLGTFIDTVGEIVPIADDTEAKSIESLREQMITELVQLRGVSRQEARLILLEQLLVEHNRGE